ncbi:type II toxin-antitoxin system RelE/ParE family toxin [Azospirillum sp. TSH64]|uniref:type II toxin-antitoxin system RelE/ParE family toxin n=1 Tax=Azospirillum sp. TSH64 TaxID=652740 RepID=UPI000D60747F|nr:type II toxin-antitoxin system RelE/ParE family toxin [Azospirillum sp. TSH64]PWC79029.1 plasmid stabilization protein [Azospirillum sp. TSH64]
MARLEFTAAAEGDLESIGDYIAQDNPLAAIRMVLDIRDHCRKIASMPAIGRSRPELGTGLRSLSVSPYLILYRAENADRVIVIRIVHGARDLPHVMRD